MILPCTYRTSKLHKSISIIFNRNQVRVPREKFSGQGFFGFFFCHTVRNLSSRTRVGTHAPCSGSMASQLLDHQGSPEKSSSYLTSRYLPVTVTTVSNKSNLNSLDYSKLLLKMDIRRSMYFASAVFLSCDLLSWLKNKSSGQEISIMGISILVSLGKIFI